MFSVTKPSADLIANFVSAQSRLDFSYTPQHSTQGENPPTPVGYRQDHDRALLGKGEAAFQRAQAAVRAWKMFALPWVELHSSAAPIAVGSTVAVLVRAYGVWSLNAARILYCIDESGPVARFGFAYGTLPHHIARGEERFSVEWRRADDTVWYDRLAFSQPRNAIASLIAPFTRPIQIEFGRGSNAAMQAAVHVS